MIDEVAFKEFQERVTKKLNESGLLERWKDAKNTTEPCHYSITTLQVFGDTHYEDIKDTEFYRFVLDAMALAWHESREYQRLFGNLKDEAL